MDSYFVHFKRVEDQIKNAFWYFFTFTSEGKIHFPDKRSIPKDPNHVFKAKKKEDEIMDVSTKYNLIIGLRLVIHDVFDILRYLYKMNAFFFITFVLSNSSNHAYL